MWMVILRFMNLKFGRIQRWEHQAHFCVEPKTILCHSLDNDLLISRNFIFRQ